MAHAVAILIRVCGCLGGCIDWRVSVGLGGVFGPRLGVNLLFGVHDLRKVVLGSEITAAHVSLRSYAHLMLVYCVLIHLSV